MRRALPREGWWVLTICLLGSASAAVTPGGTSHWLISRDLLDHTGLTLLWQSALPVKKGEALDTMLLLDDRLYVRSQRNYVWSLERDTGEVVFSRAIAPAGFPILGWTAYGDELICVIDNRIVELDKNSGLQRRATDLELSIVAPPVRNGQFFYVSGADRRLHAYRAEDMVRIFQVAAHNDSLVTTISADEAAVVFGTDAGNLVAIAAGGPQKLWEFKAVEAMAGPIIRDDQAVFFANKDTNVYRVDAVNPVACDLVWKYQTEAVLDRAPRVTRDIVYQYALGRGLAAIDRQSGQTRWYLQDGVDLLAQVAGRAYVITKVKTLVVMDNNAGRKLYSVNFAPVAYHAANTTDAKIYVADEQGRVACLAPAR